jgi:hypothetical protein
MCGRYVRPDDAAIEREFHLTRTTGKTVESTLSSRLAADGEAILVTHAEKAPSRFAYSALMSIDSKDGSPAMLLAGNNSGGARLFPGVSWEG